MATSTGGHLLDFERNALRDADADSGPQHAVPGDLPFRAVLHHRPEEAGPEGTDATRALSARPRHRHHNRGGSRTRPPATTHREWTEQSQDTDDPGWPFDPQFNPWAPTGVNPTASRQEALENVTRDRWTEQALPPTSSTCRPCGQATGQGPALTSGILSRESDHHPGICAGS